MAIALASFAEYVQVAAIYFWRRVVDEAWYSWKRGHLVLWRAG